MASFAPVRGTRTQINNTPIVDGQILFEIDQGDNNVIYMDNGSTRATFSGKVLTSYLIVDTSRYGKITNASQIYVRNYETSEVITMTRYNSQSYMYIGSLNTFSNYEIIIKNSSGGILWYTYMDTTDAEWYQLLTVGNNPNDIVLRTKEIEWFFPYSTSSTTVEFRIKENAFSQFNIYVSNISSQTLSTLPKYTNMTITTLNPNTESQTTKITYTGTNFSGYNFILRGSH